MQKEFRAVLQLVREIGSSITVFIERAGAPIIFGSQPRPNLPLPHFTMECVLATVVEVDGGFDDSEDLFGNDVPADGLQMDATTQQHQSGPPSRQSKPSSPTNTLQPPTRGPQQWAPAPQHGHLLQQLPHGATVASSYQGTPQNFPRAQPMPQYPQLQKQWPQPQQWTSPQPQPSKQQTCDSNPSNAAGCSSATASSVSSVPHPRLPRRPTTNTLRHGPAGLGNRFDVRGHVQEPAKPTDFSAPQASARSGGAPLLPILSPYDQRVGASYVRCAAHHALSPAQNLLPPAQQTNQPFQQPGAYAGRNGTQTTWGQPPEAKPAGNHCESDEDEDAVPGTPPDSPLAAKRARW